MEKSITVIIREYLKNKGISQVYLAEMLKESPQNLANKLKKNDLDTNYVRRISLALQHDFFTELSKQLSLPKSHTEYNDDPVSYNKDKYLKVLEENVQLHRELMKINKEKGG